MPAGSANNNNSPKTGKMVALLQASKMMNKPPAPKEQDFTPWGDQAETARKEGWYHETDYKGEITYRSNYALFNNVIIPGQNARGHIAVVGKSNNQMDVVIKNDKGEIVNYIYKNASPNVVQDYFTKQGGSVSQRVQSIKAGTNIDKPDAAGNYVSAMK